METTGEDLSTKKMKTRKRFRKCRLRQSLLIERRNLVKDRLKSNVNHDSSVVHEPKQNQRASFADEIRGWSKKHSISMSAITHLLKILISFGFTWLPSDYRSLLHTPRDIEITQMANGQCWYNGIEHNLRQIFSTLTRDISISLKFNVDGLPLFKSSKQQFWPILASIQGKKLEFVQYLVVYVFDFSNECFSFRNEIHQAICSTNLEWRVQTIGIE